MAKLVSKVYGDALFSLAVEENKLDNIWEEVKAVRQAFFENQEFLAILGHPDMTQEKKFEVLKGVFEDKVSQDMMGFFKVLVKKGRLDELLHVLDYFNEQALEYKKIGVVEVKTPMPLTDSQKEQVEKKLLEVSEYESLKVEYVIDTSVLGGMVIRIGDRVLDNSIKTKMDSMARQLFKVKLQANS